MSPFVLFMLGYYADIVFKCYFDTNIGAYNRLFGKYFYKFMSYFYGSTVSKYWMDKLYEFFVDAGPWEFSMIG